MSEAELARRAGISQTRVSQIERAEISGALKLETLTRLAESLDSTLVYAIVPNTSLDAAVRDRARAKARGRLASVAHSMRLEDQAVPDDSNLSQLDEVAELFIDRPGLWSDE